MEGPRVAAPTRLRVLGHLLLGALLVAPLAYSLASAIGRGSPKTARGAADVAGRIEQARARAEALGSAAAYVELSRACIQGGLYEEGIEACRKAIALDPLSASAHSNLGYAQALLRRFDEGEANLTRALELDSGLTLTRNNLNWLRGERQKALQAVHELAASVEASPSAAGYSALAAQYAAMGMHRESIQAGSRSLAQDARNPELLNLLCASYNSLGQWEDAVRTCQIVLELWPDHPLAKKNLAVALKAGSGPSR